VPLKKTLLVFILKQWDHWYTLRYISPSCFQLKQLKHAFQARTRLMSRLWNWAFEFYLVTAVISLGFVHFVTGLLLYLLMGPHERSSLICHELSADRIPCTHNSTLQTQITLSFSRGDFKCTKHEDFLSSPMIYYVWIFCAMCNYKHF